MSVPSVTINTNNYNNYDAGGDAGAQGAQRKQLSPAMLEVIRDFGLEGNEGLVQQLLDAPADFGASLGPLLSASDKLDGMSEAMGDVFAVMLLIAKAAQENREASRGLRDAEQQSQLTSMQEGADQIREAADFALAAGIVSGVMKMTSGAISIGGGLKGMSQLKGIKAGDAGADIKLEQFRAQGRVFDGSGQMVGGGGDIISSGLTRASEEARAEEKELDADAKKHEMAAEKESDFMTVNRDMIGKVAQLMQEISRLNSEGEKAAATI